MSLMADPNIDFFKAYSGQNFQNVGNLPAFQQWANSNNTGATGQNQVAVLQPYGPEWQAANGVGSAPTTANPTANTGGFQYTPPTFNPGSSSSPWSNIGLAGLGGLLTGSGNVATSILGALGASEQMGNIGNIQENYANYINSMTEQLPPQTTFKPYTVSTGLGTTGTTETGGVTGALSGQQQALSDVALGGAQGFLTQAQAPNQALGAQSQLFGAMLGGYQPTGMTPYQLSGQYGASVGGLGAQGTTGYNPYALQQQYQTGYTPDTVSPYGFGSSQASQLANQAYGLGSQGLATAGQAGAPLAGLQTTAAQQAQGMLSGLGGSTAGREADIYGRIRAMQTPEEQRQQLALEERLASQGRLGVSTAQFGGTPEQMAMDKARAEAQNTAAYQAMQQAQAEQQQQYAQGVGLAGLTGQLAGQGSDLQTAAQARATQLSNMGLSAEQINSQLQSEGLSRGIQAGTYGRQGQQLASDLMSAAQARDIQRGQFGQTEQQLQSDLANQELQRRLSTGEFGLRGQELAGQLAAQQQAMDIARGQFSLAQQLQGQQMGTQDIQNMLALAGGQQGALAQQLALQQGLGQLGVGMLGAGYSPYEQLRADFGMSQVPSQLAASGRETSAGLLAQLGLGGLAEQTKLETLRNNLLAQQYQTAAGLFGGQGGTTSGIDPTSIVGQITSGAGNWLGDTLGGFFSNLLGGGANDINPTTGLPTAFDNMTNPFGTGQE